DDHLVVTLSLSFLLYCCDAPRDLHSFPTRRSSDLRRPQRRRAESDRSGWSRRGPSVWIRVPLRHFDGEPARCRRGGDDEVAESGDRKSTRLNSSHVKISYAVFCLKKKKNKTRDFRY